MKSIGPTKMSLPQTTARINAALARRRAAGQCVDYSLDDVTTEMIFSRPQPITLLTIKFADGDVITIESDEASGFMAAVMDKVHREDLQAMEIIQASRH